jgi:DNA-binding GntR family transcriptional regulator
VAASKVVVARARDAELAALEEHLGAFEAGSDYLEAAVHDLAFHRAIVILAANERMASIYEQMLTQTMLLLRRAAAGNPTLRSGMRRSAHRDILEALRARDGDRARAAIEEHYRYAEERLFGALDAE